MNAGIVIHKADAVAEDKAKKLGMGVCVAQDWALPWPCTLFIAAGTCVPWDLVSAGFGFLERWDAAAPLWRYGATAGTIGTPADRKRTQAITHDLRLMVYAHELLFVRNSKAGQAFVSTWRAECAHGDERLAFLRALYIVKPMFCALPRSWLADLAQRERSDEKAMLVSRRDKHFAEPLIRVEIAPGRFVQCHARDKDKVLERYKRIMGGRHG